MFKVPTKERKDEIEARHEAMRIPMQDVPVCPKCGNEKTRCVMANDEKTVLMMECPNCKNAWMHKR